MTSRQPACEPCRRSKLACDHARPSCSRCRRQKKGSECVYRASPFRRKQHSVVLSPCRTRSSRRVVDEPSISPQGGSPSGEPAPPLVRQNSRSYPNPGFLGQSSHVSIFSQIFSDQDQDGGGSNTATNSHALSSRPSPPPSMSLDEHPLARQGADILRQLLEEYELRAMESLVLFWRAGGVNLALAEPLVELCASHANYTSLSTLQGHGWHLALALRLLENTYRPLESDENSTMADFSSQFLRTRTRWETLGIFLSAVLRATMDIPCFPSLYTTESAKRGFRNVLMRLITCALDICLSLDCLNDIQLIFQYENFIIHSFMNGDQSYHLWRRLGDVISTTFAIGYHESVESRPHTPPFLVELRKTAFARIYSADKNISLFLGRPLRMSKRFCQFQIPDTPPRGPDGTSAVHEWNEDSAMSYRAETRWSALCASIKEEIMELLFDRSRVDSLAKVNALQAVADTQWAALPASFRAWDAEGHKAAESPFARDFMISVRLNHLHICFLLRRVLLSRVTEPDGSILAVAQEMLRLVVGAILLRDELANSGTTLGWKIAHYGLPAAGMILVAALAAQPAVPECFQESYPRIVQDLSVLGAELERGTIVKPQDPNYALLSKATQAIHKFLDFIHGSSSSSASTGSNGRRELHAALAQVPGPGPVEDVSWFPPQLGQDLWDSEIGFWQGLVEHPSLLNQYLASPG
ncbi:hypothetical protein JDV02_000320 [Purpureocillium takamizusanense]|uniref:Zn(2)-C6 fungal-type domain-containing protein n=1 Tax=Purpureocillium takamizusanense TaxID=2060973 RepID=A0A9Q8V6A1_9HYPO|nr:uncharacterized protein JDV02_000320 [Purpureocillium takamizusanense]UNI13592.1 hypothetical protein JDV02_000320 [Purpureocillium takamizusanense]